MNDELSLSPAGLDLLKRSEGLRLNAYLDPAGRLSIGYGHKLYPNDPVPRTGITEEQATAILEADVQIAEGVVKRCVEVKLTQGQFDALTDFCYNEGQQRLIHSTLLGKVNRGDFNGAEHEFGQWIYATVDGVLKIDGGLRTRREAERLLFAGTPS